MASSLIRGKYVVCRAVNDDSSDVITDGAVFQRDGEIIEIGHYEDLKERHDPDEVIGSSDFVVIPGLINAHHHIGLTPFQLGSPDLPLEPWVIAKLAQRDVDPYLDTLYCAMQMIESGITTVMHNHALRWRPEGVTLDDWGANLIEAYETSGMRVAFSLFNRDQNHLVSENNDDFLATLPIGLVQLVQDYFPFSPVSSQEHLDLTAELIRRKQSDRVRVFISAHNVHWCSDHMLRDVKEFAGKHDTGVHIHVQETIYQKMYGTRHWGKTPLAHLDDLGFLGPEVSGAHGVWFTDSDIDLMASTGTMLCHNPSSNLRLSSGVAPINRMLERGVTVAIGIDEAGINDDNDILQEMRLAQKIHREPGVGVANPSSHKIFDMATRAGAEVTLFGNQVGTLEVGKRADIALLDLSRIAEPYLHPDTDIVDALVYRAKGVDVNTVIVDGEVLMRDRVLTRVNKEEVHAELRASLNKPLKPNELGRIELSRQLLPHVNRWFENWELERNPVHYFYNTRE
ncbi:MAG TPA: amidohydrolase family protein [Dehalococcoidia bacterium]|nr:amidohydrolase [Chloroflexota bacterium]HJM54408.1 amidohydrolase family protein [Dehalococcoidia bacterium]